MPGQAAGASQTGEVGGRPAELPRRHGRPSGDEQARARRLTMLWEQEIMSELVQGPLNRTQMTLFCALEIEQLLPGFDWRTGHPNLSSWYERQSLRPSFSKTAKGTL